MAVFLLVMAVGAVFALAALAWRGSQASAGRIDEPAHVRTQAFTSHHDEIASALSRLSQLERDTLRHLRRQGMQTFKADRDSPVLRRLAQLHLLHPMGSSAYSAQDYPYRVPDAVWSHLKDGPDEP